MNQIPDTPITVSIGSFCQITNLGRSKTYELLASGALDSLKIGKRRLIVLDSYRRLIEQERAAAVAGVNSGGNSSPPNSPLPKTASLRGRGRPRKPEQSQVKNI